MGTWILRKRCWGWHLQARSGNGNVTNKVWAENSETKRYRRDDALNAK